VNAQVTAASRQEKRVFLGLGEEAGPCSAESERPRQRVQRNGACGWCVCLVGEEGGKQTEKPSTENRGKRLLGGVREKKTTVTTAGLPYKRRKRGS